MNVMLVGHLPYLSRLASRLLSVEADHAIMHFQMGGVVRLDRDDAGDWQICWMLVHDLLHGRPVQARNAV